jgi:hypothetical protein
MTDKLYIPGRTGVLPAAEWRKSLRAAYANNACDITGKGNLTLGVEVDDLAGDITHGWSKADVWLNVPLFQLTSVTQALTFARTSQGIYTSALAAAASTGIVIVPLVGLHRKFTGAPVAAAPHGLKILDLAFGYTIATAGETTISVTFSTETQTNNAVRAATTAPFGTVTYENPIGTTVANLPVATQANPYVVRAVPGTPIFVNTDNTQVYAEISFVNPGTSVATLTFMTWHLAVALY